MAAGVLAAPRPKKASASVTGIASTWLMSRLSSLYSRTPAWNRLPPHSSQTDSTVSMKPSSV